MELRFCVKYWYGVYMKRVIFENVSITFLIIALIDLMLFLGPVYPEKVSSFMGRYLSLFPESDTCIKRILLPFVYVKFFGYR